MPTTPRDPGESPDPDPNAGWVESLRLDRLPPLLFVPDVARLLGISRQTAYSMIACGELAAVRVGKSGLRVFRDSLAEYLRGRVL